MHRTFLGGGHSLSHFVGFVTFLRVLQTCSLLGTHACSTTGMDGFPPQTIRSHAFRTNFRAEHMHLRGGRGDIATVSIPASTAHGTDDSPGLEDRKKKTKAPPKSFARRDLLLDLQRSAQQRWEREKVSRVCDTFALNTCGGMP
eukprot:3730815-Rhodomonas_salina.2